MEIDKSEGFGLCNLSDSEFCGQPCACIGCDLFDVCQVINSGTILECSFPPPCRDCISPNTERCFTDEELGIGESDTSISYLAKN